jgi:outer membrane protein assembly factor BamE (lipoprotein component of BamABCDE complex)
MNKKIIKILLLGTLVALLLAGLVGCATPPQTTQGTNPYTQGNVTLNLKKGVTTQEQVANAFGAPNIVTQDASDHQVWIYQKNNVTVQSGGTSAYATIIIAGVSGGSSGYAQSSQTMTLIIKFNNRGIVSDFKSMSTSF